MHLAAQLLAGIVAAIHVCFLILEMVLWRTPRGRRIFGTSEDFAAASAALAANQGLYNGFLAAGLVWGALAADPLGFDVRVFFLICVIVAGAFGAATVSRRILMIQAIPGGIALLLTLLA